MGGTCSPYGGEERRIQGFGNNIDGVSSSNRVDEISRCFVFVTVL